ncbi:hypothetical protein [Altererythrobacter sp.]|uniref:hypothetical protein n=1 Tax=Altererythrobacter sp. TaxID=1872480 RepID=UPI003D11098F
MHKPILAIAALTLGASSAAAESASVPMFARAQLSDDVSLVTYGIMRDTRCNDPKLCFQDERLVVGVVVTVDGQRRDMMLEMGVPVPVADGWLELTGSPTQPRLSGATPLPEYQLDYSFYR